MDGDSAAISKDITDNDAGKNNAFLFLFPFHVTFLYVHCLVHRYRLFEMIICYFSLYSSHPKCSKYLITTSLS